MRTLLVTGVGGPAGRGVATVLHEAGHHVVGADMLPVRWPGIRTVLVPAADDPAFVPALSRVAREIGAELVVPTVSEELPVLAGAGDDRVVVGSAAAVGLAADKWSTARALGRAGVAVPRTVLAGTPAEWSRIVAELGSPVVGKPRRGRGGRGVVVHRTEPGATLRHDGRVLQEFAPGTEYCPAVLRHRDGRTDVVVLEKVALAHGEVGNAVAVRRVDSPDVAALAVAAVTALGLTGPADVDVRRRADGTPVVLEVNARFGAHAALVPELVLAVLARHLAPA